MRKLFILAVISSFMLTGCNTFKGLVNGLGKDTQKAGEWMQDKTSTAAPAPATTEAVQPQ